MPVPLPILRALDLYTRTLLNLAYNEYIAVPLPPPKSELFYRILHDPRFSPTRLALLSQLEGGQPAPESPKKPAPFIASPSTPASPTNHPDILRADIADLLALISSYTPANENWVEAGRLSPTNQAIIARCRTHIQEP